MCLAQGHNTVMPVRLELGPSVSSQAIYHCAPPLKKDKNSLKSQPILCAPAHENLVPITEATREPD